jgi:mono/diheme cytochrome c family protein
MKKGLRFAALLSTAFLAALALACPESEAAAKAYGQNTKEGSPALQWEKLASVPGDPSIGRALYEKHCLMCHGATGDGKGELLSQLKSQPRDFADTKFLSQEDDTHVFYDIAMGVDKTNMAPYYPALSVREIKHVVAYVRVLGKGGSAPKADYRSNLERVQDEYKDAARAKRLAAHVKKKAGTNQKP